MVGLSREPFPSSRSGWTRFARAFAFRLEVGAEDAAIELVRPGRNIARLCIWVRALRGWGFAFVGRDLSRLLDIGRRLDIALEGRGDRRKAETRREEQRGDKHCRGA